MRLERFASHYQKSTCEEQSWSVACHCEHAPIEDIEAAYDVIRALVLPRIHLQAAVSSSSKSPSHDRVCLGHAYRPRKMGRELLRHVAIASTNVEQSVWMVHLAKTHKRVHRRKMSSHFMCLKLGAVYIRGDE